MNIKGVHTVKVGVRWYVYAWRGGPKIMQQTGGPRPSLDGDALARYIEAVRNRHALPAGTVSALAAEWRTSPEWEAYSPDTKKQWGYKLAAIETKWGTKPLAVFDDRRMKDKVIDWRDTMRQKPRTADFHMQVLRALLAFACARNRLSMNVAEGIPTLYKGGNRAAIIWEPIERYVMELGLSIQVSDAFRLANLTGLRRSDLVRIPLSAIGDYAIVWATQKSGKRVVVTVPMISPLRDLIAELRTRPRAENVGTLLVNSYGQSWTPDGLNSSFGDERDAIGFDKHLHDARGTYATELCLAGLTDAQIAGILGWGLTRIADIRRIYVDQARTLIAIGERLANNDVKPAVK